MSFQPLNANGQATMANSAPVVTASDQIFKDVSFSTTSVAAVGSTDVGLYKSVSVHIVTQGTSSLITFQGSNNNTNWVDVGLVQPNNTLSSPSSNTTLASVMFVGSLNYRYFRLNVTGISAGTTAGVIEFSSIASPSVSTIAGQIALNGTQAVNVYPSASVTGLTAYSNTNLLATATSVKGSAARWYNYNVYNPNGTVAWLQVWNTASGSVTVGTTTPFQTFPIPPNGFWDGSWQFSLNFSTALTIATTTTATGNTAPATGLNVNLGYL